VLSFRFFPFIDVFLRVYLNITLGDSVSCIMSTQPNHAIKTTNNTPVGGIRELSSYHTFRVVYDSRET